MDIAERRKIVEVYMKRYEQSINDSKYRLNLNLQTFNDGGQGGGDGGAGAEGGQGGSDGGEGDKGGKVTFTTEQQAEVDRIIGERLSKTQAKWEKDYAEKLDAAKTEAEKLAKMNADQKAEYEKQKREKELSDREANITRRELKATAYESLAEKGLPKDLAELLDYSNAESTSKSIESVEKAFRSAVEAGVNERLKGNPPGGGGGTGSVDTSKMTYSQLTEYMAKNPGVKI
jgi:hypothetical protein